MYGPSIPVIVFIDVVGARPVNHFATLYSTEINNILLMLVVNQVSIQSIVIIVATTLLFRHFFPVLVVVVVVIVVVVVVVQLTPCLVPSGTW